MRKTGLLSKILIVLLCLSLPVAIVSTWVARGIYDSVFHLEGRVHLVNATDSAHKIVLEFPSGERLDFEVAGGASVDGEVQNSGEGAITVTIDEDREESVGYVTTFNSMIVLTVGEDRVVFSQIIP